MNNEIEFSEFMTTAVQIKDLLKDDFWKCIRIFDQDNNKNILFEY